MQIKYLFIALLCLTAGLVNAQDILKGSITESGSNTKLTNVFIRDNNTKQLTLADKQGNFSIKTETGHLVIFESPGYLPDTLYVADLTPKKIRLTSKVIALKEVSVNSTRAEFDPRKEYPEVYTKSKVYVMSPSSWFSKEGKDARRLKKYFQYDAEQRHVDAVFSKAYVGSIVPLKGQELDDFMVLYRPSYAFVSSNGGESMTGYINDSYKKYEALPPEKRALPRLTNQ